MFKNAKEKIFFFAKMFMKKKVLMYSNINAEYCNVCYGSRYLVHLGIFFGGEYRSCTMYFHFLILCLCLFATTIFDSFKPIQFISLCAKLTKTVACEIAQIISKLFKLSKLKQRVACFISTMHYVIKGIICHYNYYYYMKSQKVG